MSRESEIEFKGKVVAIRSARDLAKRFGWEAEDITVRDPSGKIIDISKKPDEPMTGKDVVPKPPDEK